MKTLINKYTLISVLFITNILSFNAQTPVLTAADGNPEYACPGSVTSFNLEPKGETLSIKWIVTGGYFNGDPNVTEVTNNSLNQFVYWKNVSTSNGTTPIGTIKAVVKYKSSESTTTPFKQKIISLNGAKPSPLSSSIGSNIEFGEQRMHIDLDSIFYFPGVIINSLKTPVSKFEWTIPSGWRDSHGKTGTFIAEGAIDLITNSLGKGVVKVRGVNDCASAREDKSEYSSLTFTRNIKFTTFPQAIKYGEAQTYNYTVTQCSNCTYEWSYPAGWSSISGENSNSVILSKDLCATSAAVKVRIKANNGEVSDWFTCPNTTLILPEITAQATVKQFTPVNLSVSLPNSVIQSFTISGDGLEVLNNESANTLKCVFNKSGDKEVSISLSLIGCSTPLLIKKIISVSQPDIISIQGPVILCSGSADYSVNVQASGMTWSVSNNIQILSGQGTSKITVKALTYGDANISLTMPNYNMSIFKNIYTGTPIITSIYGSTNMRTGIRTCYEALPDYNTTYKTNVVNYIWQIDPTDGVYFEPSGNRFCVTFMNTGLYRIFCRATSSCGSGMPGRVEVSVGNRYFVSNTSGMVDIKPISESNTETYTISDVSSSSDNILYNMYNSATGIQIKSGQINKSGGTINCTGLPKGTYILKIKLSNNKYETHKIIL